MALQEIVKGVINGYSPDADGLTHYSFDPIWMDVPAQTEDEGRRIGDCGRPPHAKLHRPTVVRPFPRRWVPITSVNLRRRDIPQELAEQRYTPTNGATKPVPFDTPSCRFSVRILRASATAVAALFTFFSP